METQGTQALHPRIQAEAARLAAAGERTKAKVARELGIRVNQLRQWRLDFEEEERNGVPKKSWPPLNSMLGSFGVRMPSSARRTSFKKSGYLLRGGVEVRYAFIDTQRGSHAVRTLCRTLRVSASGYYDSRSRKGNC